MFKPGQKVWHVDGTRSGVVLDCEGGRVYIEQDNGAELDLPEADVTGKAPDPNSRANKPTDNRGMPKSANAFPPRPLLSSDITSEHIRVLHIIPVRTVQAIAALYDRATNGAKFNTLAHAAKLNVIAEFSAVPFRVMQEYRDRPGELGLLMGKGIADRRSNQLRS